MPKLTKEEAIIALQNELQSVIDLLPDEYKGAATRALGVIDNTQPTNITAPITKADICMERYYTLMKIHAPAIADLLKCDEADIGIELDDLK